LVEVRNRGETLEIGYELNKNSAGIECESRVLWWGSDMGIGK